MFGALIKLWPGKIADFEAKLAGVNGFTGRGEIEYAAWKNGAKTLEVELYGIAGRIAEIYVNNDFVITVDLNEGRADYTFSTRRGTTLPTLTEGGRVEVRQNGDVILEGVLIPD